MAMLAKADALEIARAGILAPSADNKHMLEFEIGDDEIRLLAKPEFLEAPFHRRILALMAFGAVVENMRVEAKSRGLDVHCGWFPRGPNAAEVATVRFAQ